MVLVILNDYPNWEPIVIVTVVSSNLLQFGGGLTTLIMISVSSKKSESVLFKLSTVDVSSFTEKPNDLWKTTKKCMLIHVSILIITGCLLYFLAYYFSGLFTTWISMVPNQFSVFVNIVIANQIHASIQCQRSA